MSSSLHDVLRHDRPGIKRTDGEVLAAHMGRDARHRCGATAFTDATVLRTSTHDSTQWAMVVDGMSLHPSSLPHSPSLRHTLRPLPKRGPLR